MLRGEHALLTRCDLYEVSIFLENDIWSLKVMFSSSTTTLYNTPTTLSAEKYPSDVAYDCTEARNFPSQRMVPEHSGSQGVGQQDQNSSTSRIFPNWSDIADREI